MLILNMDSARHEAWILLQVAVFRPPWTFLFPLWDYEMVRWVRSNVKWWGECVGKARSAIPGTKSRAPGLPGKPVSSSRSQDSFRWSGGRNSSSFLFPLANFQVYSHVVTPCQLPGCNPSAALCSAAILTTEPRERELSSQELTVTESLAELFCLHIRALSVFFFQNVQCP